jgi:TrpR family transcriptional regulator, trp operon repressor
MNQTAWREFIKLCLITKNEKMLSDFFSFFLTQEEKENIALRYLIINDLLKQEKTQRNIAKDRHVSIAKITRGSNELKRALPKLIKFLKENIYH